MSKARPLNGTATAPAGSGTYFLSLSVKNVRCFGEPAQTLDLSDGRGRPARWTVLLGNNGTGKTTLLQALASCETAELPVALAIGDEAGVQEVFEVQRRLRLVPPEGFARTEEAAAVIEAGLVEGGPLGGPEGRYQPSTVTWELRQQLFTARAGAPASGNLDCYGYGASRRFTAASLSGHDDHDPTATLFSDDAPLRNAEEWLLRLDYSASKPSEVRQRQRERLRQVQDLLTEILPEVDGLRFTASSGVYPTPGVQFETPYGWVGLRQLGHGYRTLIAWVVDFVSRLVEQHPESPDPFHEPAVVLVDEIDLHLHPIWQRQLMSYLTRCFPNTQFIVTAHSPLIVQAAAEDANIALLRREGDRVVIDNDVENIRGWRIDQLLTSDLFGLPSARPPQFDQLFKRREELLTKARQTKADKEELARLEEQIGSLPFGESPEQIKTLKHIEETINLLKRHRDTVP